MVSKLSKIGFGTALAGTTLDLLLESTGNNSLPPISNHIGNWTYISTFGVFSVLAGRALINKGVGGGGKYLVKIGESLPKVITVLTTFYFTIGESILPQILPGTADHYDIPAVLLAGISTYLGVDVITKYRRREKPQLIQ